MVRHHGWQLPAHAFQVVAITLFFLLVVAFYVFLAPFIGSSALEYASIVVYSPAALLVFALYIRCSAIDPSDPGIFINHKQDTSVSPGEAGKAVCYMPSHVAGGRCFLCGCLGDDEICKGKPNLCQATPNEEVLFCTLCNAEVFKFSKHCRSCDKCVDGFDHHCRWLNNCVGRKNYITFVWLMAASLTLLILEWGIGSVVLAQCFINRVRIEGRIVDNLGNGFSRAPFAAIVVCCTLISLFASLPLGELFFFHVILIRKGITTYEYVVAMRAQSEAQVVSDDGDPSSLPSSPTSSSATVLSVSSSLGIQYRGAWCTPPRIFVDQDEIVPHLGPDKLPSTVDPDSRREIRSQKRTVKINAWKLARLNPEDAAKAVLRANASSSTLRPIGGLGLHSKSTDYGYGSSSMSNNVTFAVPARSHAPGLLPSLKFGPARGSGELRLSNFSSPSSLADGFAGSQMNPTQVLAARGGDDSSLALGKTDYITSTAKGQPATHPESGTSIFYGGPMTTLSVDSNKTSSTSSAADLRVLESSATFSHSSSTARRQQSPVFVPRARQQQ